ncbi:MAG: O-antigen ligase family protein [Alphaproteobacteria bacterium]
MEEAVGVGLILVALFFVFTSLLSWRWAAAFLLPLSILDLHLFIPVEIPLEPGVTIHGGDVFFVPLAVSTLIRLFSLRRLGGMMWLWLLLAAYMALSFVHGVFSYGLFAAAASYRATLYLSVGVLYFATFDYSRDRGREVLNLTIMTGLVLVLCALVAWMVPDWRPVDNASFVLATHTYERNRVLPAQAALFIALAAFATLPFWLKASGELARRLATLPLMATAVFLFHRSVWVTLSVGILAIVATSGQRAIRALLVIQGVVLVMILFWVLLVALDLDVLSDPMRTAVIEVADTSASSLDWRIQGWRILVERAIAEGPMTILFGAGFGIGFERTIAGSYVVASPHNYYVELFLTSGLVGCALFLLVNVALILSMLRLVRWTRQPEPQALVAILLGLLVYGVSYSPQYDGAMLMGLALTLSPRARVWYPQRRVQALIPS